MKLYKCQTTQQFKIGEWLESQGLCPGDVACCELLAPDAVKVVNPAGQYLVVCWRGGHAEIDMTKEESGNETQSNEQIRTDYPL